MHIYIYIYALIVNKNIKLIYRVEDKNKMVKKYSSNKKILI
jgi:hypothetical protein